MSKTAAYLQQQHPRRVAGQAAKSQDLPLPLERRRVVATFTYALRTGDAVWFVEPNVWLGGAAPIELMNRDPEAVLLAARADRFVAAG